MSKLNKSTVGLGKVINRLQTDGNDFNLLKKRLKALEMDTFIEGNWTTLLSNTKVSTLNGIKYVFNLDNNQGVDIILNDTDKIINLKGGLNGRSFYFRFKNQGNHVVHWDNVRTANGESPYLTVGTTQNVGITSLTVTRVGNEYYISDINNNVQ